MLRIVTIKVYIMTTIKHGTVDLPAYWASALVNGDYSGMTDSMMVLAIHSWLDANPSLVIDGCNDESYIGRYDGLLCDMLTYSYTERG
jgi:hypothetical protein